MDFYSDETQRWILGFLILGIIIFVIGAFIDHTGVGVGMCIGGGLLTIFSAICYSPRG